MPVTSPLAVPSPRLRVLLGHSGRLALLLLLSCVLAFGLLSLSPLDPIIHYLGGNLLSVSEQQRLQMARELGLDAGFTEQLLNYLQSLANGELGQSLVYRQPVSEVIAERLPLSLMLMGASWVLAMILGYVLGVMAALNPHSWLDNGIRRSAWVLASMPPFWLAMLLISVFSVSLSLTPVCCAAPLGQGFWQQSFGSMLQHLLLPVCTLTLSQLPPLILHTREKVLDILQSDYVTYARLHHRSGYQIFAKHVFGNSLKPVLILHFASFAELFGGSVLAETVFNFPGLGSALVKAGLGNDAPLMMGITLFSALFVFVGNVLAEVGSQYLQQGRLSATKGAAH
ncbi:ABC transporter permease [Shewanella sp. YIC-542]|uniref:ABC transporter permease n=1 Tax=Shewanella mytili TaxID=3377111 RepID=UPI00398E5DF1